MKAKFVIVSFAIFSCEAIVLTILGYQILHKKLRILGASEIIPLNKNSFSQNSNDAIVGFYEPNPQANEGIQKAQPKWLTKPPQYNITSDGFNDRRQYPIEKTQGTYRIITIGDSFTFGQYVDVEENYPEMLEDLLNNRLGCNRYQKFEVINLGVPGYDLEFSLERFHLRGQQYEPDLVLFFARNDDFEDLREFTSKIAEEKQSQDRDYSQIWANAYEEARTKYSPDEISKYHGDALARFGQAYAGKILIFTDYNIKEDYLKILESFTKQSANRYLYTGLPDLAKLKQTLPDTHPNPTGYKTIANDLLKFTQDNQIANCE